MNEVQVSVFFHIAIPNLMQSHIVHPENVLATSYMLSIHHIFLIFPASTSPTMVEEMLLKLKFHFDIP